MSTLPKTLQRVINEFAKLPGIGQRSAQRLAFFLLKKPQVELEYFAEALQVLKSGVVFCETCNIMSDELVCKICSDTTRETKIICVVEESMDAIAIDSSGQFRGKFHVLGGVLNPLEGVGPEQLYIQHLADRVSSATDVEEIIIATNPTLEGETTALHVSKVLREKAPELKITRIARGLPMGGDLEYTDQVTLTRALEGRRDY